MHVISRASARILGWLIPSAAEPEAKAIITYTAGLNSSLPESIGNTLRFRLKFTRTVKLVKSPETEGQLKQSIRRRLIWYVYCATMSIKGAPEGVERGVTRARELAHEHDMGHHVLPFGGFVGGVIGAVNGIISPIVMIEKSLLSSVKKENSEISS